MDEQTPDPDTNDMTNVSEYGSQQAEDVQVGGVLNIFSLHLRLHTQEKTADGGRSTRREHDASSSEVCGMVWGRYSYGPTVEVQPQGLTQPQK